MVGLALLDQDLAAGIAGLCKFERDSYPAVAPDIDTYPRRPRHNICGLYCCLLFAEFDLEGLSLEQGGCGLCP